MGIFSFLKRKKKQDANLGEVPQFHGREIKTPLGRIKPKQYVVKCVLVYKERALREFEATEYGYSRDKVAENVEANFKIKVLDIHVKK